MKKHILTGSVVAFLFVLGSGVALDAACSPSVEGSDGGDAGPVCDPDSGDPAGCPCDPNKTASVDCYSGPPGTSSKGICKPGKRSCDSNGKFTVCVGEVTPQPETCNYTDDDCDGLIDDLPELADAAIIGRCNSPSCDPSYTDAAITCWGPDPGICGAGVKACQGTPTGGQPTGCIEFVHTPSQEICNGIDDDCNGTIDDGLDQEGPCDMPAQSTWPDGGNPFEAGPDGSLITHVFGECVHGNLTCVDTSCGPHGCADAGDQCFPSQPTTETCDGLDNDCNGAVDDHACKGQGNLKYCCTDGFFFECDTQADIPDWTSCKLAN